MRDELIQQIDDVVVVDQGVGERHERRADPLLTLGLGHHDHPPVRMPGIGYVISSVNTSRRSITSPPTGPGTAAQDVGSCPGCPLACQALPGPCAACGFSRVVAGQESCFVLGCPVVLGAVVTQLVTRSHRLTYLAGAPTVFASRSARCQVALRGWA
jgi:hypothetical protein